jgi:CHASE2 domain-containing sensor protein
VLLLTAAAVAASMCLAYVGHVLGTVEDWTMDKRFAIRGAHTPDDVVIAAIDDRALNELGAWPLPRRYHAELIDKVATAGPSAIAVDIQFTEPTNQEDDNALIASVASAGHIVLGTTEVDSLGRTDVFGGYLPPGARAGFVGMRPDAGGVLRRVPWGSPTTRRGRPATPLESLALVTAEIATGGQMPQSRIGDSTTIAYVGPPGPVPAYSYLDVLQDRVPANAFKGKVVVIGAMVPSLGDVHTTPYGAGKPMSGPEIEANAIETALHNFPLRPSRTRALLLIVLFSFLVPVASLSLRWRWCLLIAGVGALLYLVAAQVSFDHGVLLAVTWPLIALALGTLAACFLRPPRTLRPAYS